MLTLVLSSLSVLRTLFFISVWIFGVIRQGLTPFLRNTGVVLAYNNYCMIQSNYPLLNRCLIMDNFMPPFVIRNGYSKAIHILYQPKSGSFILLSCSAKVVGR